MTNSNIKREIAKGIIKIDNEIVKITEYKFSIGAETSWHKHHFDYVVMPITNGKILLVNKDGSETISILNKGNPYFRKAGVEHNVINIGNEKLIFSEIEIKSHSDYIY